MGSAKCEAKTRDEYTYSVGKASACESHDSWCGGDEKHPKAAAGLCAEGQTLGTV